MDHRMEHVTHRGLSLKRMASQQHIGINENLTAPHEQMDFPLCRAVAGDQDQNSSSVCWSP